MSGFIFRYKEDKRERAENASDWFLDNAGNLNFYFK